MKTAAFRFVGFVWFSGWSIMASYFLWLAVYYRDFICAAVGVWLSYTLARDWARRG